jgi:hypothetical protein
MCLCELSSAVLAAVVLVVAVGALVGLVVLWPVVLLVVLVAAAAAAAVAAGATVAATAVVAAAAAACCCGCCCSCRCYCFCSCCEGAAGCELALARMRDRQGEVERGERAMRKVCYFLTVLRALSVPYFGTCFTFREQNLAQKWSQLCDHF